MANSPETKKGMGKGLKIVLGCFGLILLAIIFSGYIIGRGVSEVADNINENVKEQEEREEDAFEHPKRIGEAVFVKDVEWVVTGAKDLGSRLKSNYGEFGDDCVAMSGAFVEVSLKIKNNSKSMVTLTNLNLYDENKREYITSSDVLSCTEETLFILDNINPGIQKTFVAIYEVPSDAKNLRLKVGGLDIFSDGHEYVSLGF